MTLTLEYSPALNLALEENLDVAASIVMGDIYFNFIKKNKENHSKEILSLSIDNCIYFYNDANKKTFNEKIRNYCSDMIRKSMQLKQKLN